MSARPPDPSLQGFFVKFVGSKSGRSTSMPTVCRCAPPSAAPPPCHPHAAGPSPLLAAQPPPPPANMARRTCTPPACPPSAENSPLMLLKLEVKIRSPRIMSPFACFFYSHFVAPRSVFHIPCRLEQQLAADVG